MTMGRSTQIDRHGIWGNSKARGDSQKPIIVTVTTGRSTQIDQNVTWENNMRNNRQTGRSCSDWAQHAGQLTRDIRDMGGREERQSHAQRRGRSTTTTTHDAAVRQELEMRAIRAKNRR